MNEHVPALPGTLEPLLQGAPVPALVLEADGRPIFANPAAEALIAGRREGFLSALAASLADGEDMPWAGNDYHLRLQLLEPDSRLRVCWIVPVTECSEIQEENALLKAALDALPNTGILLLDRHKKIRVYNKVSSSYDGFPQSVVLGRDYEDVFFQSGQFNVDRDKDPIWQTFSTRKPHFNDQVMYAAGGKKTVYSLGDTFPLYKGDQFLGVCCANKRSSDVARYLSSAYDYMIQVEAEKKSGYNGTRYSFKDIIGSSDAICMTIQAAKKAARVRIPVLIYGETGTGKELIAQSIHNGSPNRSKPFVAINCAALPDTLVESILFGSRKGAFTGAENTAGLFEQAGEGTLFLDEINSLSPALQSKLLRTLQEMTVRRLGGNEDIPVNCRIIASTNTPPRECLEKKLIREDLYYRLAVLVITIPPLRERRSDIPLLARHFRDQFVQHIYSKNISLSEDLLRELQNYGWPGNVRELQHVLESMIVMAEDNSVLTPHDLSQPILSSPPSDPADFLPKGKPLREALLDIERSAILRALERNQWNVSRTARELGYTRSDLHYRISVLGL